MALVSNLAIAESFTHEEQIASPDVSNQSFDSSGQKAPTREVHVSLDDCYRLELEEILKISNSYPRYDAEAKLREMLSTR